MNIDESFEEYCIRTSKDHVQLELFPNSRRSDGFTELRIPDMFKNTLVTEIVTKSLLYPTLNETKITKEGNIHLV